MIPRRKLKGIVSSVVREIKESDWKLLRCLYRVALERLC
jgi:hypothetical protein